MSVIGFRNVDVGYGNELILGDVTLDIPKGAFCLIRGANGSGKSSLLKSLLGLSSTLAGKIIRNYSRVSYVPQRMSLDLEYPVSLLHLIRMGRRPENFIKELISKFSDSAQYLQKRTDQLLESLSLTDHKDLLISQASGGQIQKALIGRAFLSEPDLLVLDEPFSNLDKSSRKTALSMLREYQKKHSASICVADHLMENENGLYDCEIVVEDSKAWLS